MKSNVRILNALCPPIHDPPQMIFANVTKTTTTTKAIITRATAKDFIDVVGFSFRFSFIIFIESSIII